MNTSGPAQTHYMVLDVSPDATSQEIKRRYRELAHSLHPDMAPGVAPGVFVRINLAYQVLHDADRRRAYDAALRGDAPPAPPAPASASLSPQAVVDLLAEAETAYMQGKLNEACAACQKALRADGRSVKALALFSDILILQDRPDHAAAALRLALQVAPNPVLQSKLNRLQHRPQATPTDPKRP